jgi:hypothetical protein
MRTKGQISMEDRSMVSIKNVPMMLSIPKKYRDVLRKLAAERNLENPDKVTSAAQIGSKIICEYLEKNSELIKPHDEE